LSREISKTPGHMKKATREKRNVEREKDAGTSSETREKREETWDSLSQNRTISSTSSTEVK